MRQRADERARVLIADGDEESLARTVQRLCRAGYEVLIARDGEEALARATAEHPDLCVLDAMTPKLNGYDVTRRLHADARTRDLPVLLMTASHRAAARAAPGADRIATPCTPHELRARVQALLARSR